MRKYLPYFLIFAFVSVLILIFLSQSNTVKFNTVTVPNKFSISIPEYLSKTDSIDSSALLQYKNEKKKMFMLMYEKNDSENVSLDSCFRKFSNNFIAKMDHGILVNYYPEKINNTDAVIGDIRGSVNETEVCYRIALFKTKGVLYKIIIGISSTMKSSYDEDINQVIQSITF